MKKRMSLLVLPLAAGLALVLVAITSWASGPAAHAQTATPTVTNTPTVTATPNPSCVLRVDKNDNTSEVAEGGQITYTIRVHNDGAGDGSCNNLDVTDTIPDDTDCVSASVTDDNGLDFDTPDGCDTSGDVTWHTDDNLDTGEEVELEMVAVLTSGASNGDHIENTACADSDGPGTVLEACDTERTLVGGATVTPTPVATTVPTAFPTIAPFPTVIVPLPTARPLPTLSPPITGTGSTGSGGSGPLVAGLGLAGVALLLVSGFALVKRTR